MSRKIPSDAFELYVGMGLDRSYEKVAKKYGVTKSGLVKHALKEDWQGRLQKLEDAARESFEQEAITEMVAMRVRHLKVARAIQSKAVNGLRQHTLTSAMESVRAADVGVRLERLVAGEDAGKSNAQVEEITRKEIANLLKVTESGQGPGTDVGEASSG